MATLEVTTLTGDAVSSKSDDHRRIPSQAARPRSVSR